jgi:hypothetical protein
MFDISVDLLAIATCGKLLERRNGKYLFNEPSD